MTGLTTRSDLPVLTHAQAAKAEIDQLYDIVRRLFDVVSGGRNPQVLRPLIAEAEAFIDRFEGNAERLTIAARPATSQHVSELLAATIGSIPGSHRVNAATFSVNLVRMVSALQPSRIGLEGGCEQVMLQCEEFPSIAKFVSIVREADYFVKNASQRLNFLRSDLAEARQIIREKDEVAARRLQREARDAGNVTAIRPTA